MSYQLQADYPIVMGVLNVTPDSFYDGGKYNALSNALAQADAMIEQGVGIIDVGGESTRPGAKPVSLDDECQRVLPVIEHIAKNSTVPISIDTRHTDVMRRALDKGAVFINDVNALQDQGAVECAAAYQVPICLMHMQGLPETMQDNPNYQDVFSEIKNYLQDRMAVCLKAGIEKHNIFLDPGFGFGKTLEHNLILLGQLAGLKSLGCKILVGLSRKSMFGKILEVETQDRLNASLAGAAFALLQGADIIRVHDVKQTQDVIKVFKALKPYWENPRSETHDGT